MAIFGVLYNEELTKLEAEWRLDRSALGYNHPRRIYERREANKRALKRLGESMVAAKRLDESRQIELAQMAEFIEDDETFLAKILDEAGVGLSGDYERYRLNMAKYWLNGARSYIEDVIETYLARDIDDEVEVKDIPVTVVLPDKVKFLEEKVGTTTVVDDKGQVSTADILDTPTPKSESQKAKPWIPSYKDEDKIKAQLIEIINDTPVEDRQRPGFQGWLMASATAALGGKTEPALMLSKVREVLES